MPVNKKVNTGCKGVGLREMEMKSNSEDQEELESNKWESKLPLTSVIYDL